MTNYDKDILDMKAIRGKEIVKEYDLSLLKDRATDDDTEYSTTWFPVFAVGEQADLAAGMQGGAVSPWCKTEAEAYAWCNDNFDFLAGMYKDD
jgi:hypothetical protein